MKTETKVYQTMFPHTCLRCGCRYENKFHNSKLCPDCREWAKGARRTHCMRCFAEFDRVQETKYGKEYHCPKCGSWINFGILADVFSLPKGGK